MVTGRMPFHGPSAMAMLMSIAIETPPSPLELNPHLPMSLSALIMQMLAKSPEQRPANAIEVAQRLTAIEQEMRALPQTGPIVPVDVWNDIDMPTELPRYEPTISPPPVPRRWPMILGIVASVLLPLIVVGVILTRSGTPTSEEKIANANDKTASPSKKEMPHIEVDRTFDGWLQRTLKLKAQQRLEAVRLKLQEFNPKFNGTFQGPVVGKTDPPIAESNQILQLAFSTDEVTDIHPLLAIPELRRLGLHGGTTGQLTDLSPLRGMQLTQLRLYRNQELQDLSPLAGMPLTVLHVYRTRVKDLKPLLGMPLEELLIEDSDFADFSILPRFPLKTVRVTLSNGQQLAELRKLWHTTEINSHSRQPFWRANDPAHADYLLWIEEARAMKGEGWKQSIIDKLIERNPGFDGNVKLASPAKADRLVVIHSRKLVDISPLRGLPYLTGLTIEGDPNEALEDITPLRGYQMRTFVCPNTGISDLWTLAGMPLTFVNVSNTKVSDLRPLRGMRLESLHCDTATIPNLADLRGMQIRKLECGERLAQDLESIRSLVGLEEINGMPVAQFWKQTPDAVPEK